MKDQNKSKAQLISELHEIRQNVEEIKQSKSALIKMEKALRLSEEKFAKAFRNSPDAITITSLNDDCLIDVNDKTCQITGFTKKELIGSRALDLNIWVNPENRKQYYNELKQRGRVTYLQADLRMKSGEIRNGLVSGEIISLSDGNYLLGTIRDITELKKAQKACDQAFNIINKSPAVIFLWRNDENWSVEYVTENVKSVLGYTTNELISGKVKYRQIIHPDDLEKVSQEVSHYSKQKDIQEFVHIPYRIMHKDGDVIWIDDRTYVRRDEKYNITHYQGIIFDITSRKQAEEALRKNESRLRALVSSIDEIVFEFDKEGRYENIWVNNENLLVLPASELLGSTIKDILGEKAAKPFTDVIKRVISNGFSEIFEYSLDVMGGKRWFNARVNPIVSDSDVVNRASFIARDITERKQMQDALSLNEERLDLAMSVSNDGLWDWDLVTNTTYFDPRYYTMAGYKPNEFPGTFAEWAKRVHPEDFKKADTAAKEYIDGEIPEYDVEFRFKHKNGEWIWIRARGKIVARENNGTPLRMVGTHADITHRKQAEEALQESEERFRTMFETNQAIMLLIDPNSGKIEDANPAACKFYGYSHSKIVKELYFHHINTLTKKELKTAMRNVLNSKRNYFEFKHRLANGAERNVETYNSKSIIKGKELLYSIVHDITERKKAENELRENEAKFKAIIQNVNEGIIYADNQGSIIHVNEAISRMVGIPIKDIIGKNAIVLIKQLVSAKQIPKILKKIAIAFKGKSLKPFELEYNDRILEISTTYDKSLKKITGIIRDITERKQFEKTLSENEEKLRNVVENSTNLFFSHTTDHKITYISPQCREFLQCEPEEAMIRWTEFVTDNPINEKGFAFTQKAIKTGKRQPPYELELIGKEGKIIQVEVNEAPIKHKNKTIGIVGSLTDITERKKAEEALYDSEKLLRQVIDASPYSIYVKDKEGRYILVNKKMAESHNTTPEKLVGKTDLSVAENWLTTPEKIKKFRESELEVINGKQPLFIKEDKFTFLNGTERWYQTIKSPISLKDNPDCLMGVAVDITERKQAEISLFNEKLISEEYINSLPGLFYIFDEERFVRWNKEWIRVIGYSNEELSKMYGTDFFEGEDKELIAKRMQEVFTKGSSEVEAEIITKHGKHIPYYFSGLRKEFNGKPHLIGLGIDITGRKEAERALLESEEKYRLIVENANDGIEISQNDKIFFANSCFADMLGYTIEEIKDIPISKIFTEQGTYELIERNEKRNKGLPLPNHYETTFTKKDGSIIDVDVKYEIIQYKNEPATFAIIRDITLRKQVEKEKEILEKQLRRSQKLETIGTLAGGIAHDFNNILAPIMGYTDMALLNLEKSNPLYDDLQHVLKGANRAKELVEQILLFSKQSEKERQSVAMQSLVKEALKFIRPSIPTTIVIQQRIDDSCAKVKADATQLNQVIINLCTNAWQVMEEKGGTLSIELNQVNIDAAVAKLHPNLNESEYIRLSVSDTGPGMDEETQERIFEPFFTTKTVDKGTGLGLSVVHGIVRGHKGDIHVHSQIGKGTTFHVYLPTIKSEETVLKMKDEEITGGSECVLVVDDETAVAELVKRILENFGYKAQVVNNGLDALQAFKKNPGEFDLIISDLTMPQMTGLDLADRLHKEYPDFPVMIMTGFGDSITDSTRERYGIKNVIGKPIVVKDLTAAVRKIFDK